MGGTGRVPTPAAQRRRRNKVEGEVEVQAEAARARSLPAGEWHANAEAWWTDAVGSPAAVKWVESDWALVHRALVMVHQWWVLVGLQDVQGALRVHAELMKLEKKLYLSPEDRARGHIEVKPVGVKPSGQVATPVTAISKWQGRLSG